MRWNVLAIFARGRTAHRPNQTISGGVRHHAVAAVAFGAIERLIGALENAGRVVAGRRQCRDTDRDRDFEMARALLDRKGSVAIRRRRRSATTVATAMSVSGITITNSSPP